MSHSSYSYLGRSGQWAETKKICVTSKQKHLKANNPPACSSPAETNNQPHFEMDVSQVMVIQPGRAETDSIITNFHWT